MQQIFIVSDGTGGTAEQILRAALTQFADTEVNIERRSEIREESQIVEIVKEAAEKRGVIIHTLVSLHLRQTIKYLGRLHTVETIDLMGPLLAQLAHQFEYNASEEPGLFRELNKEYFKRIESMEFALRHDDGQRTRELINAELVLLGVSRTFKTPLSIYFAFKGWFVGNVPIVAELPLPAIIYELPPERVFCLTTDAHHLSKLRRNRESYLGGATGEYAELASVRRELAYANRLYNSQPKWAKIRVTNKPIEEIASQILMKLRNREW